ncbi:hypothetical protein [Micromonospora peucetia]|uniref:hypothetical protein n=1 Tax=Micromonospora peucetia TaxID=47871 RepID=UPI00338E25A8
MNLARAVGPAVAGVLVARAGVATVLRRQRRLVSRVRAGPAALAAETTRLRRPAGAIHGGAARRRPVRAVLAGGAPDPAPRRPRD